MYQSILVPTDGSDLAGKAVKEAAKLAKTMSAKLVLFHVIQPYPNAIYGEGMAIPYPAKTAGQIKQEQQAAAKKILAAASKLIGPGGIAADQEFEIGDQPYRAIIAAARKHKCDLIAMASHGRGGLGVLFLGSETQKVLAHSKIPVLVVR